MIKLLILFTLGEEPRVDALGLGVSDVLFGLLLFLPSTLLSGDLVLLGDFVFFLSRAVEMESPLFFSCSIFHALSEL
jgi:hypothetical protein